MPSPWTGKPHRLERVFSAYEHPVYFVTCVTSLRQPLLNNPVAHESLVKYGRDNAEQGRAMGRYVLMPDHLHFLVRLEPESRLSDFVRLLKQQITRNLKSAGLVPASAGHVWQPGFFDRLLRNHERYGDAWAYIRENAPAAGLTDVPENWPYQGESVVFRY